MATVSKLLKAKEGNATYAVGCDDTIFTALKVMAEANISAVLVTEGEQFVGIFTERDYARKVELAGLLSKETPVKALMTKKMITVAPSASVDECMRVMMRYHVRHLPVVENERIIGVLSMRDIIDEVIASKESEIAQLENYILGTGFSR